MTDSAIVVFEGVTKQFDGTPALRDVRLAIPTGAVIGLIGRNGSGKSTLLHHITGLQLPTAGGVRTFGVATDQLSHRELCRIGVVHQHSTFPGHLTVSALRQFVRAFHTSWDQELEHELTARLELSPKAKVGTLSPGNRQRLAILLALCHRPSLLLLDEPFSDLDPEMRRTVLELLMTRYAEDRPTILLSSHLLHDIEPVITHVLALHAGRVTTFEEFDAVKERLGANLEQLFPLLTGAGTVSPDDSPIAAR